MEIRPALSPADWDKMKERFGDQAQAKYSEAKEFLYDIAKDVGAVIEVGSVFDVLELQDAAAAGNPACFDIMSRLRSNLQEALLDHVKRAYSAARG